MNNFIFYSPTEFVFGRDTEAQTGVLVQKYGARKIMIALPERKRRHDARRWWWLCD